MLSRALAGGVTSLGVLPGSANLVGGRGVVLRTVPARGARAMRFPGAPEIVKMACGENPKRVYGTKGAAPSTRMGNLRAHRQAFLDAEKLRRAWQEWGDKLRSGKVGDAKPPDRNLDLETLVGILEGRFLVQWHCYRADDMLSALQLADEFCFAVRSFHHAVESYKIRDVLAERAVATSTWADWWGFKFEAWDAIPENAALLTESGARAVIHSDSAEGVQRLNQEAGKALAAGRRAGIALTDDQALRWVTANPAWVLGIDGETGTLEKGKRADLVVWDGQPFSVYAKPRWVFIDGALFWDSARPRTFSDTELGWDGP
jgi:imidazolonepropionase-like amidohydrolase